MEWVWMFLVLACDDSRGEKVTQLIRIKSKEVNA